MDGKDRDGDRAEVPQRWWGGGLRFARERWMESESQERKAGVLIRAVASAPIVDYPMERGRNGR